MGNIKSSKYINLILYSLWISFIAIPGYCESGDPVLEGKDVGTKLEYTSHPTITTDTDIIDKKYADDTFLTTESDPLAIKTSGTDNVKDTHIDWGTGAGQISADDLPDGSTNVTITTMQETNFETAYTHSQAAHAPSNAEQNVNADWGAVSGDAQILNKPTLLAADNTPDNGGSDAAGEDWAYDMERGTLQDTFTINNDLQDVTSKLIFVRTTGGNGEISYDGIVFNLNNPLTITTTGINEYLKVSSTNSYAYIMLNPAQAGDVDWLIMGGYPNAGDFTIRESNVGDWFNIKKTTGQVGINTTTFIGTEKLRVNGNQYIDDDLTVDNVTLTEGQIVFPATQNASSNANTLDDYKEGTYEPTVVCSTSGSYNIDSNYKTFAYIKIGRLVHIQGQINITSGSSPSGQIRISLPFTSANLTDIAGHSVGLASLHNHGGTLINGTKAVVTEGLDYFTLRYSADNGATYIIEDTMVDTEWLVIVSLDYIAAN